MAKQSFQRFGRTLSGMTMPNVGNSVFHLGNIVDCLDTGDYTLKLVRSADVDEVYRMLNGNGSAGNSP